ncbi:MAG TPA: family 1 glycosylhydrolase [Arachnia sp.]|nr:family 1 glycosylhydrolase [Arachnia sp.]
MTTLRPDFLWGAATAAHQIEGDNYNSDFWAMEHSGMAPHIKEPSGSACDSWHRYREDIRLLAEGGLTTYRFSVEWARIEPADGLFSRAALLHYRDMIDACHEHGVTPVVTLHHFTYPQWFAAGGGSLREDAPQRFAAYTEFVSEILHDVEWVVTINEPNILALFGLGLLRRQRAEADAAAGAVAEAQPTVAMATMPLPPFELATAITAMHRAAVEVLRRTTTAKVGWAIAAQALMPTEGNEAVWETVFHQWEGVYYEGSAGDDFIGMQSYTSQDVDADGVVPHPESPDNTLTGWAYRPDALGINLRRVWEVYGIPLLVTENGIATADDTRRIDYTRGALRGMIDAVADGVDVLGYCHWSLLDNYEWGSWAPTFGLIAVDRDTDFARHPKPSLAWLGSVAASNGESI